MKKTLLSAIVGVCALFSSHSFAAGDCDAKAAEKKLAGAAKASFVKKCEKDSAAMDVSATCEKAAADKKLAGAAKTSNIKKCMADAQK